MIQIKYILGNSTKDLRFFTNLLLANLSPYEIYLRVCKDYYFNGNVLQTLILQFKKNSTLTKSRFKRESISPKSNQNPMRKLAILRLTNLIQIFAIVI